jgi:hypothetical protein
MAWKAQIHMPADGQAEARWITLLNAVFETREEAEAKACAVFKTWPLADRYRAVESV